MPTWTKPRDELERIKQLEKRQKGSETIFEYDPDERPGPVQNVDLDFRVREKHHQPRYRGVVTWDAIAPGVCQADILAYNIQLEPCDVNGNPKEAGRRLWATYVVKHTSDLEPDNLRAAFEEIAHPRKWYYRARVRVVDKDGRQGEWSPWTTPRSPQQDSNPLPPTPTGLVLVFDLNEKDRHEPRHRAKVRFNEIQAWDVPPTANRDKATASLNGAITAAVPADGGDLDVGSTNGWADPAAGERVGGVIRPHSDERELFSYAGKTASKLTNIRRGLGGTIKRDHPNNANVISPKADQQEAENDLESYEVQLRRCDSAGVFLKDADNKFIQRTEKHPWKAELDDNDNITQCIFPNVRKRHFWKARVRTIDRFHRKGDWTDWSNLGSPSDTTPPPQPNAVTVDIDNHKVHVDWESEPDTTDPDIPHVDIAFYQVELHRNSTYTNLVKKDFYVTSTKKAFKVKRASTQYWARVRSVDASNNKSAWVTSNANKQRPPQPSAPFNITFDENEKEAGAKLRALVYFTYDEVGYNEDHIDRYVVEAIVTNGAGFSGTEDRRKDTVAAQGDDAEGDANDPKTAHFKGVPRHKWIRARVRAIDKDNRRSPWSSWSSSYQVTDSTAPPAPSNVSVASDVKGVFVDWEAPGDDNDSDTSHNDVKHYEVEVWNTSFTIRWRRDRHVVATKKRYKGLSEGGDYAARVRSVGATNTKSGWVTSFGIVSAPVVDTIAIVDSAVTTPKVDDLDITNPKLANGAVTFDKISVTSLSAINANLGSIIAGSMDAVTITGGTITGTLIRTASTGARVVLGQGGELDRIAFFGTDNTKYGEIKAEFGHLLVSALSAGDLRLSPSGSGFVDFRQGTAGAAGSDTGSTLRIKVNGTDYKLKLFNL